MSSGRIRRIFSQQMNHKVLLIAFLLLMIQADQSTSEGSDLCRCFCCPSSANPYKDKAAPCDPKNPPLVSLYSDVKVGSVPIAAESGALACNALACNGYFSIECPPAGLQSSKGAAVRVGCKSCPDGKFTFP